MIIQISILLLHGYVVNQLNNIAVGSNTRQYYVAQKGNPNTLIVYWYRTGGTYNEFEQYPWYTSMNDIVVASPVSLIGPDEFEWLLVTSDNQTDVELFDAILSEIQISAVYVTGFSAGAIMTSHLVFLRAVKIQLAAIEHGGFAFAENYNNITTIPRLITYTGGPTDMISLTNFTIATNIFLNSVRYANADIYTCKHDQGHLITPAEGLDVYKFLVQDFTGLSSNCTNYNFTYSTEPVDKTSASGSKRLDGRIMFYIVIPVMFVFYLIN